MNTSSRTSSRTAPALPHRPALFCAVKIRQLGVEKNPGSPASFGSKRPLKVTCFSNSPALSGYLPGMGVGSSDWYSSSNAIYGFDFNRSHNMFALILPMKIVLRSEFHGTKLIKYEYFHVKSATHPAYPEGFAALRIVLVTVSGFSCS